MDREDQEGDEAFFDETNPDQQAAQNGSNDVALPDLGNADEVFEAFNEIFCQLPSLDLSPEEQQTANEALRGPMYVEDLGLNVKETDSGHSSATECYFEAANDQIPDSSTGNVNVNVNNQMAPSSSAIKLARIAVQESTGFQEAPVNGAPYVRSGHKRRSTTAKRKLDRIEEEEEETDESSETSVDAPSALRRSSRLRAKRARIESGLRRSARIRAVVAAAAASQEAAEAVERPNLAESTVQVKSVEANANVSNDESTIAAFQQLMLHYGLAVTVVDAATVVQFPHEIIQLFLAFIQQLGGGEQGSGSELSLFNQFAACGLVVTDASRVLQSFPVIFALFLQLFTGDDANQMVGDEEPQAVDPNETSPVEPSTSAIVTEVSAPRRSARCAKKRSLAETENAPSPAPAASSSVDANPSGPSLRRSPRLASTTNGRLISSQEATTTNADESTTTTQRSTRSSASKRRNAKEQDGNKKRKNA